MLKTDKTVTILDSDKSVTEDGILYRWNGYDGDNRSTSLLQILENNSDELRQRFLKIQRSFVSTLSNNIREFSNNSSIEIALLWSSLLVEKSPFKSPCLLESLRLLALEMELKKIECTKLRYIGPQRPVVAALRQFCKCRNIKFYLDLTSAPNTDSLLRRIRKWFPSIVRSVVFLIRYARKRWDLRKAGNPNWFNSPDSIFLFSYFINLDRKSCETGQFYSKQWEDLPEVLRKSGRPINWMHIFLFSQLVPDTATGIRWVSEFNRNKHQKGVHTFIDSFLGWDVLYRSLQDYFSSCFRFFFLNKKIDQATSSLPYGWLWPVLRKDWQDSTLGISVMKNILWFNIFNKAMASLPHQRLGLYLCENQGWERAFIRSWREYGHGKLIGVAPTTISYWDVRYFDQSDVSINMPRPDVVAVNGPNAWETLRVAGQPMNQYVQVEALRFLYFNELPEANDAKDTLQQGKGLRRLLILGDYQPDSTHRMLLAMEKAFTDIKSSYKILIKPHPANPVDLRQYPLLQAEIVGDPLSDLLPQTDQVFTSVFTSAGLEAFCAGITVISYLDPYNLNWSIVRDIDGLEFISSSKELVQALERIKSGSRISVKPENFFWLDSELPRWRKLLKLNTENMQNV